MIRTSSNEPQNIPGTSSLATPGPKFWVWPARVCGVVWAQQVSHFWRGREREGEWCRIRGCMPSWNSIRCAASRILRVETHQAETRKTHIFKTASACLPLPPQASMTRQDRTNTRFPYGSASQTVVPIGLCLKYGIHT